jgi:CheY-like chemotaxis protein
MKKGRIFHLEDDPEWVEHIQDLLGNEYEIYSASNLEQAAELFVNQAAEGHKFDLAIIDISLIMGKGSDKKGFKFIEALEKNDVLQGFTIIVLSGFTQWGETPNWRIAFRDYNVVDVYDKGDFKEEKEMFKQRVNEIINLLKN